MEGSTSFEGGDLAFLLPTSLHTSLPLDSAERHRPYYPVKIRTMDETRSIASKAGYSLRDHTRGGISVTVVVWTPRLGRDIRTAATTTLSSSEVVTVYGTPPTLYVGV